MEFMVNSMNERENDNQYKYISSESFMKIKLNKLGISVDTNVWEIY